MDTDEMMCESGGETKGCCGEDGLLPVRGQLQQVKLGMVRDTSIVCRMLCYACGENFAAQENKEACYILLGEDEWFVFCSLSCRSKGI